MERIKLWRTGGKRKEKERESRVDGESASTFKTLGFATGGNTQKLNSQTWKNTEIVLGVLNVTKSGHSESLP